MNFKTLGLLTAFLTLMFGLQAQDSQLANNLGDKNKEYLSSDSIGQQDQLDFSLNVGASVLTGFSNGALFSRYIQPELSYQISPKFSLISGLMINSHAFSSGNESSYLGNLSGASTNLYLGGNYQVNDELSLSGMGVFDMSKGGAHALGQEGNHNGAFRVRAMEFQMQYEVTDNFKIGAGARFSKGFNYRQPSLFNNGFNRGPSSMFGPFNSRF